MITGEISTAAGCHELCSSTVHFYLEICIQKEVSDSLRVCVFYVHACVRCVMHGERCNTAAAAAVLSCAWTADAWKRFIAAIKMY